MIEQIETRAAGASLVENQRECNTGATGALLILPKVPGTHKLESVLRESMLVSNLTEINHINI
jgi:hypothetical protein